MALVAKVAKLGRRLVKRGSLARRGLLKLFGSRRARRTVRTASRPSADWLRQTQLMAKAHRGR